MLSLLEKLEKATPTEKIEILKTISVTEKRFLELALDPKKPFGVKKPIKYVPGKGFIDFQLIEDVYYTIVDRKKTGNELLDYLRGILSCLRPDSAEAMHRFILKDLRCGVQWSTLVRAFPELDTQKHPVMLAGKYNHAKVVKFLESGMYAQLKLDGLRLSIVVDFDGNVSLKTRSGKEIHGFESIRKWASGFVGLVIDGEMVFEETLKLSEEKKSELIDQARPIGRENWSDSEILEDLGYLDGIKTEFVPREIANGWLLKSQKSSLAPEIEKQAVFYVFDVIPHKHYEQGVSPRLYVNRLEDCKYVTEISHYQVKLVPTWEVKTLTEIESKYAEVLAQGLEGLILKPKNLLWKGSRSVDMMKMKNESVVDLKITGIVEGTGKYQNMLGAIEVSTADGSRSTSVGTGFTDQDRLDLWHDLKVGDIVSIKYNMLVGTSFFLPVFISVRPDKLEADNV